MIKDYDEQAAIFFKDYFLKKGMPSNGVASLMGASAYAEASFHSNNLQNSYNKVFDKTDEEFTKLVDEGLVDFASPNWRFGYGLAQWTSAGRRAKLWEMCVKRDCSISDLTLQCDFMWYELNTSYKSTLKILMDPNSTISECAEVVTVKYECPAAVIAGGVTRDNCIATRVAYSQEFYEKYFTKEADMNSNSPLVSYVCLSPNKNSPRKHAIDTITIHCYVGQVSVERGCQGFQNPARDASCNYVIGTDGRIGLCVEEKDRSWCTSNATNDHRAITIECASDSTAPYAINGAVMDSLIKLCADICKRNGIKTLVWSTDKSTRVNHKNGANMTVHRDYANKACPGDYIYNRLGDIAYTVNNLIGANTVEGTFSPFKVRVNTPVLNVRKQPTTLSAKACQVKAGEVYTIVEVKGDWGRLKSGAGWIHLGYTQRL